MDIKLFSNQLDYKTFREVDRDGKAWIVINGVPIVEGVLNKFFLPYDEFSATHFDWNDVPIVINHPQQNNGSARVDSPDVPVVGRFYNSTVDTTGRRLTGEFWLDKTAFLASADGQGLYDKMKSGQPVEVSTGYYAPNTVSEFGKFNGKDYQGIHKSIHPDHIAILTNELGACSIMDGCGLNRNSAVKNCESCPSKVIANMTGNLPAEGKKIFEEVFKKCKADGKDEESASKIAWAAVKKAGWSQDGKGKWMMHNEESLDEKSSAIRDAFYALNFPINRPTRAEEPSLYLKDVYADHIIVKSGTELYLVSYQKESSGYVFTPRESWKKVEQAYVEKNQQSADKSPDWFAKAKSVLTKEFLMQNKVLKAFLHTLGFDKVTIEDEGEGLSLKLEGQGDDKALEGLMQLNTVVKNSGGADEFAKTFESLKGLPASVAEMQKQMNDALALVKNASAFAETAAVKAEAAKKGLITGLVANKACPFDEATLTTMSVDVLEKLDASYQPVDYTGLGAGLFSNVSADDDKPLMLPVALLAKKQEA
jgi:cation transport regulator ChaB